MRAIAIKAATILSTLAAGAASAAADDDYTTTTTVPPPTTTTTVTTTSAPMTDFGVSVMAGGGVQDFASSRMTDTTDPGGMWDIRAVVGSSAYIGGEAAYTGSAQKIQPVFGNQSEGNLIGTGLEADLRVNALPLYAVTPYAFAGLGWRRYDVTGEDFSTSDTGINDSDDQLEVPLGAGVQYHRSGFIADARFTYRVATYEDMVVSDQSRARTEDPADMDTWGVAAHLGYEF